MPQCTECQENCDSWQELAQHILKYRESHRAGTKWALAFLSKARLLNQKRDLPQRTALTEDQREARESSIRELSGMDKVVRVQCPICKSVSQDRLEVEFTSSPFAWHSAHGYWVTCRICCRN